jgi:hypothetical protein
MEARQEQSEGAVLAQQIADLKRESDRLLKSAREKEVIGSSQLAASQALAKEAAEAAGELITPVVSTGASTKKGKGGGKGKVAAPVAAASTAPAVITTAKKGRGAAKGKTAPAVVAAAPEAPAAAGKPGKKTKEKAAAASASASDTAKAKAKVVRSPGEKGPPLHEKIKIVMGTKDMTIQEVIEALRAHDKNWVPKSQDLGAYISLVLSTHLEDHFDRVKRGVYKVKKSAQVAAAPVAPTGPGAAKTGLKKANGSNGSHGIDEFGTNVLESPFAGAEVAA